MLPYEPDPWLDVQVVEPVPKPVPDLDPWLNVRLSELVRMPEPVPESPTDAESTITERSPEREGDMADADDNALGAAHEVVLPIASPSPIDFD